MMTFMKKIKKVGLILVSISQMMGSAGWCEKGTAPMSYVPENYGIYQRGFYGPQSREDGVPLRGTEVTGRQGKKISKKISGLWAREKELKFSDGPFSYLLMGGFMCSLVVLMSAGSLMDPTKASHKKIMLNFFLPSLVGAVASMIAVIPVSIWENSKKSKQIDGAVKDLIKTHKQSPYSSYLSEFKACVKTRRENVSNPFSISQLDLAVFNLLEKLKNV